MNFSWKNLEDHVRNLAEFTLKKPCVAEHINGVDFDGVIRVDADEIILLEITKKEILRKLGMISVKSNQSNLNMQEMVLFVKVLLS